MKEKWILLLIPLLLLAEWYGSRLQAATVALGVFALLLVRAWSGKRTSDQARSNQITAAVRKEQCKPGN